jgi:putative spermidine/putrescine transport system ATP-binding protein
VHSAEGVGEGQPVNALVRPENVAISREPGEPMENEIEGIVSESLILGEVIRHYVTIPGGGTFLSVELNRPDRRALEKGTKVRLGWRAVDMRLLAAEIRAEAAQ